MFVELYEETKQSVSDNDFFILARMFIVFVSHRSTTYGTNTDTSKMMQQERETRSSV